MVHGVSIAKNKFTPLTILRPNKTVYAPTKTAICTPTGARYKFRPTVSLTTGVLSKTKAADAIVANASATKATSSSAITGNTYQQTKQPAIPWYVRRQQAMDRAIDNTMDYLAMQEIAHTPIFSDDEDAADFR